MFSCNGTTPLATVGQSTIKIRFRKYINAAQHESGSLTTLESAKMIVAAYSGGQPQQNCARLSSATAFTMSNAYLLGELVATYRKHGWELRGALLQPATHAEIHALVGELPVKEAEFDALWFSRPSHQNREAWELRLLAQTQYALFEAFEPDETEEERDEVRREMEARLKDYVAADSRR